MPKSYWASALLLSLSLTGCSRQFQLSQVEPGQTDVFTAVKILGDPEKSEVATETGNDESSKLYSWGDITLQARNDIIRAIHRSPAEHERSLQFWRQRYKDKASSLKKLAGDNDQERWQFSVPSKGISIIYDERSDHVLRVVRYEIP